MEATGWYGEPLAEFMHVKSHKVSMVNPFQIKSHGQSKGIRNKTDKIDATCIADFCKVHTPSLWSPMIPEKKRLRSLSRAVNGLKDERTVLNNRLENNTLDVDVVKTLKILVGTFDQQIKHLEKLIIETIMSSTILRKDFDLLKGIKGVGIITIVAILTEMPDVNQFDTAKAYAAYAGLNPRHHQSGSSVFKKCGISKMGGSRIRKALFLPAVVVKNNNEHFQNFCERLAAKGKAGKVIVVAIMRKLLHIIYGILKHQQAFDGQKAFC